MQPTDETLYEQLLQGNKLAFRTLYERYFDKLCRFAQQFNIAETEDIVQEVFIKVIEQPQHFNTQKRFSTWVYTAVANKCKNALRDQENRARIMANNTATYNTELHANYDVKYYKKELGIIFKQLTDKEKHLFVLKFEHKEDTKAIAHILGIPEGSVKSGLFYLLKKISTHLNQQENGNT